MRFPTPILDHLTSDVLENVYDPAEDSFLFMDALNLEEEFLKSMKPKIIMEIGCGSGCVTAFLARWLQQYCGSVFVATDVNHDALMTSKETFVRNNVQVELIGADLLQPFLPHFQGMIDVLLFNPPYVPTSPSEVGCRELAAAWAGGINGRQVIDRLLPEIPNILSNNGVCYMVLVEDNKPQEIIQHMKDQYNFESEIVAFRKAGDEHLSILKMCKKRME